MSDSKPERPERRDFLDLTIGGSAAAFALTMGYPVLRYMDPETRGHAGPTEVGKLDELPLAAAKTVLVGERPVLVLRAADGEVRAFSAICTHLQCVVQYSQERRQIECPCHRGLYSLDGRNISGPPPRRLRELTVIINDGTVLVSEA